MDIALFLAKVWGLFAILLSLGLFINRKSLIKTVKNFEADTLTALIAGVFTLGVGIAQVVGYDSWTFDWKGIITLFGWISLFKGVAIIFMPGYLEWFAKTFAKESWYATALIIFFILGAYLLYTGFTTV